MKKVWAIAAAAGITGCATTTRSSGQSVTGSSFCMPCEAPCTAPCAPALAATFDPAPGTFTSPQRVRLSTRTPGAVIHYTTDGTDPTEHSSVYRGPISLDDTTTIKAMAQVRGLPRSRVSSGTYTIAPPPPQRVAVTPGKLELPEKVHFEVGRSVLAASSAPLLDEVALALQQHPEVKLVVIEGHTDAQGGEVVNETLSKDRAEAVRQYLIGKGIAPDRLESQGFGSSRPIADNDTSEGREANRRVDFIVVTPPSDHPGEMGTGGGPSQ